MELPIYLGGVLPNPEIPDGDSLLGLKLLARHVHLLCVLVLVLVVAAFLPTGITTNMGDNWT